MSPGFAAPPGGLTPPVSSRRAHPTGRSLCSPGSRNRDLHTPRRRKELSHPSPWRVSVPTPPGVGVGVLLSRCLRRKSRGLGAELPGGAGREGTGGVPSRRGPAGTNHRRGGSWVRVAGGGSSSSRSSRKSSAPRNLRLQGAQFLEVKAGAIPELVEVVTAPAHHLPKAAPGATRAEAPLECDRKPETSRLAEPLQGPPEPKRLPARGGE